MTKQSKQFKSALKIVRLNLPAISNQDGFIHNHEKYPKVSRESFAKQFDFPLDIIDLVFKQLVIEGRLRIYWLSGVIPRHGDWTPKLWAVADRNNKPDIFLDRQKIKQRKFDK